MNKGELVDAVASKTNITKKQADEIISAFLSVVTEAVARLLTLLVLRQNYFMQ
ncbi:HU family DNA-binding protein [Nostoc sp. ATCC 53789]|uniref:HU family DNA-binding protein n=1 Tax=Nostoc sp. ATCC 53789 TaxID=76335 RepID=UPI001FD803BB|nr:HU family DNA-binding protein [Nostoc sp. ATCC 53789]